MAVEFEEYSVKVKGEIQDAVVAALEEVGGLIASQAKRNQTRRKTGATANAWQHVVEPAALRVTIGNPLENAIWEEYGTGEYAAEGDGRIGGWSYRDEFGEWHFTRGKTPLRPFKKAFDRHKKKIQSAVEDKLGGLG